MTAVCKLIIFLLCSWPGASWIYLEHLHKINSLKQCACKIATVSHRKNRSTFAEKGDVWGGTGRKGGAIRWGRRMFMTFRATPGKQLEMREHGSAALRYYVQGALCLSRQSEARRTSTHFGPSEEQPSASAGKLHGCIELCWRYVNQNSERGSSSIILF